MKSPTRPELGGNEPAHKSVCRIPEWRQINATQLPGSIELKRFENECRADAIAGPGFDYSRRLHDPADRVQETCQPGIAVVKALERRILGHRCSSFADVFLDFPQPTFSQVSREFGSQSSPNASNSGIPKSRGVLRRPS